MDFSMNAFFSSRGFFLVIFVGLICGAVISAICGCMPSHADTSFLFLTGFEVASFQSCKWIRQWREKRGRVRSYTSGMILPAVIAFYLIPFAVIAAPILVMLIGEVYWVTGIAAGLILYIEIILIDP